jgi:hypothetical protein
MNTSWRPYDTLSVWATVAVFIQPSVGFVLAIVALATSNGKRGRGLSITALDLSLVYSLILIALIPVGLWFVGNVAVILLGGPGFHDSGSLHALQTFWAHVFFHRQ